jgi:signal transduction histidine kinase
MRGDLVNFIAYASTVPGYYYKAINYFYEHQTNQQQRKLQPVQHQQDQIGHLFTNAFDTNDNTNISSGNSNIPSLITDSIPSLRNNAFTSICQDKDNKGTSEFCSSAENAVHVPATATEIDTTTDDDSTRTDSTEIMISTTAQQELETCEFHDTKRRVQENQDESTLNETEPEPQQDGSDNEETTAEKGVIIPPIYKQFLVCILFTLTALLLLISWKINNKYLSAVAFICSWISVSFMNIYQWPLYNQQTLTPQFLWHLMVLNGNGSPAIPFTFQITLGFISLLFGCIIAYYPPYMLHDTFPVLFGATALHVAFHTSLHIHTGTNDPNASTNGNDVHPTFLSLKNDTFRTTFASVILTTTFAYHVFNEILTMFSQPNYSVTGGFSILRAGFFASFGIFAAGAFKKESIQNELLERLVQQRTKQIVAQSERLRLVEVALEASETAIAITDHMMNIVWYNPALQRLTGKHQHAQLSMCSLLDALDPSTDDRTKISSCFNCHQTFEEEITIRNLTIHIQVGPFFDVDDDNDNENIKNRNYTGSIHDVDDERNAMQQLQYKKMNNCLCCACRDNDEKINTNGNGYTSNIHASRFVVVMKDFTERRKRQLAEKAAEREAMLKQAMFESCQILSHELRTPLQGIMGITSMLLDGHELSKDVEEAMSLVMVSSRLLLTLINNMLDVRKCDANMMSEFELVPTEVYQPLDDAVNFCRPFGLLSNVQIDFASVHIKNVYALSDPLRLQQIVINLVSNSIKHSPIGCTITIKASVSSLEDAELLVQQALCSGNQQNGLLAIADGESTEIPSTKSTKVVVVSVSDTGVGIDVEQAGKLFQQFSQLDEPTTTNHSTASTAISGTSVGQPSGTGLGLNLCLKFVHRMGGKIWASNNPPEQKGANFSFYLPLHSSGDKTTTDTTLSNHVSLDDHGTKGNHGGVGDAVPSLTSSVAAADLRVLVVDDTFINLKVLDRMLKMIGVQYVVCVDSGPGALAILENDTFHLVISDIQMPGMSGIELCETILRHDSIHDTKQPVIVGLTAEDSKTLDEHCTKAGMSCVLHKPITAHQLKDFFDNFCA